MKRLVHVLRLVRVPNTFTAWADILVGFVLGAGSAGLSPVILYPLCASTMIYWAGFALNDLVDIERDRVSAPSRPLPAGDISRAGALRIVVGLLAGGLAVALFRPGMPLVAIALVAAVVFYDVFAKKTLAGPFAMGLCRFLNVLLGASAVSGPSWGPLTRAMPAAAAVMLFVAGLTFWSRAERRSAARSDAIAAVVCINLSFATAGCWWAFAMKSAPVFLVVLCAVFAAGLNVIGFGALRVGRPEAYERALKLGLSSIIIYNGLLLALAVGPAGLVVWALALPNLILRRFFRTT